MKFKHLSGLLAAIIFALLGATSQALAQASTEALDLGPAPATFSGKLLLTGGVSQVEGSAGGGLTPWAVLGGYGTKDQIGGNVFATQITTEDYRIRSYGALYTYHDRVEVSVSRQEFNTQKIGAALGLGYGYTIAQDTVGIKVKVAGDAVLSQDKWLPQIAVGAQFKSNNRSGLVKALGARDGKGIDYYVSATKLYLDKSLLLNATLRATKANQYGILGFGGKDDKYHAQFEASAAYLINKRVAIGAEVRTKPDLLAVAKEGTAVDAFVAVALNKRVSATLAYVDLGNIVTRRQTGLYASLQVGF